MTHLSHILRRVDLPVLHVTVDDQSVVARLKRQLWFSDSLVPWPQGDKNSSYLKVLLEDLLEQIQLHSVLNPVSVSMFTRSCFIEDTQA